MPLTPDEERELSRCFDYHQPGPDDRARYEAITAQTKQLAALVLELCPPGPDRDAALLKLREARMMANASIACRLPTPAPATQAEWACLCGLATCEAPHNRGSLCKDCEQLVLHRGEEDERRESAVLRMRRSLGEDVPDDTIACKPTP